MTYATEFPDFPAAAMPAVPDGFADRSWRNEPCPCFIHEASGIVLWIDYPANGELRDCARFVVQRCTNRSAEAGWQFDGGLIDVFQSDDWRAITASLSGFVSDPELAIAAAKAWGDPHALCAKWVKRLGLGFHPDTPGSGYEPALLPEEAAEYDRDMEALFAVAADPYECGLMAMEDAGLC